MAWNKYLTERPAVDAEMAARAARAKNDRAELKAASRTGIRPRSGQPAD